MTLTELRGLILLACLVLFGLFVLARREGWGD